MWIYFLVFVSCIVIAVLYILGLRQLLKRSVKTLIPSPFMFGKEFLRERKKFGIVYLAGDIVKFGIEILILGIGNAVIIRLVSVMMTFTTSGFFGRRRNLVIRKIQQDTQKHHIFREFLGDTFASLVFRVPMYIIQLMVLVAFHFTHWSNVWYSVYVGIGAILMFGRFGCFAADLLDRWLFKGK